jgi:hypothetical protein
VPDSELDTAVQSIVSAIAAQPAAVAATKAAPASIDPVYTPAARDDTAPTVLTGVMTQALSRYARPPECMPAACTATCRQLLARPESAISSCASTRRYRQQGGGRAGRCGHQGLDGRSGPPASTRVRVSGLDLSRRKGGLAFDAPWPGTVCALAPAAAGHRSCSDRKPFRRPVIMSLAANPGSPYGKR